MAAIVSFIFGIVELIVGLRFVFLLLGANPVSGFVSWIYGISAPLVAPFAGIFGRSAVIHSGVIVHSVFEFASLVALVVYALIGGLILALLGRH